MKKNTLFHQAVGLIILALVAWCLVLMPNWAQAQANDDLDPSEKFTREELAQMLAPIALYPDALLSQILMASTYPIEVIEADRWVKRNSGLKDEALDQALLNKVWDPSVKAVCHFPSILALMSERITETTSLGNAFLAQEAEVLGMVQDLRAKARAQGHLKTSDRQKVLIENNTIIVEPVNPRVVYVPYYDPFYVYGPWWYPAYPPYYWGPAGVSLGIGLSYWPAIYFGFSFGSWSYFDWHHHHVHIDSHHRPRYVRHDRWVGSPGPWQHVTTHRRGVAYRDKYTAQKYGQYTRRPADARREIRGFPERQAPALDSGRSVSPRTDINRDRRGDDRSGVAGDRQQQRIDRNRQTREQPSAQQIAPVRQTREQPSRQQVAPVRQTQEQPSTQQIAPVRQTREQPSRQQVAPVRQTQERQERTRIDRAPQERVRVERAPSRSREQLFDRVDNGSRERMSSERGRSSWQGHSGNVGDRGRSGGVNRSDRPTRDRSRR